MTFYGHYALEDSRAVPQRWRACRQASAGACEDGVGLGMVFRGTENSFCMAETNGEPGLVVRTGG